jgi:hypothetical protein
MMMNGCSGCTSNFRAVCPSTVFSSNNWNMVFFLIFINSYLRENGRKTGVANERQANTLSLLEFEPMMSMLSASASVISALTVTRFFFLLWLVSFIFSFSFILLRITVQLIILFY